MQDGYIQRWQRFMVLVTLVLSTLLTSIWFYCAYAQPACALPLAPRPARPANTPPRADSRGSNCCLELRAILGCDPAGPCLGFAGDCADIQAQFSGVQGPYLYSDGPGEPPTEHDSIDAWVCHAFPDDAYVTDQFFVGLISVAVALPVDLFLQRAFEIANESEMPGNWLDAPPGKWKLLLGKDAHNGWRLADPRRPVSEFVRWIVGGGAESDLQAVLFVVGYLLRRLRARLFGEAPPAAFAEDEDAKPSAKGSGTASESSSGSASARADALTKRLYAAAGLLGVYVTWTIMAWFIFTYGALSLSGCACLRLGLTALPVRRHAHLQAAGRQCAERVCKGAPLRYLHQRSSTPHAFGPGHARTDVGRWLRPQQRALADTCDCAAPHADASGVRAGF